MSELAANALLTKLTRLCLALPETACTLRGDHADFRVRGKVFVYFLNSHHGDGIISVCCKTELGQNVDLAGREPDRFYLPAYIGPRGWLGLRLDRGAVDWSEVLGFVQNSYALAAPKALRKLVDQDSAPPLRAAKPAGASKMNVFDKLNLKAQTEIVVLNSPPEFEPELSALKNVRIVRKLAQVSKLDFTLAFVTRQQEVDALAKSIAGKADGDAVVWFAYPKGTSKKYRSEINRDSGWNELGKAGFEPVRQVAIDADWSASRFRRAEFIKTMRRAPKFAMSAQGKVKASAGARTKGRAKTRNT